MDVISTHIHADFDALASMVGEKGQDWHLLTSGAFISMLLPLAVFFALQRYFVRGMMAGSVKG